ncbi:MAG: hypothetical protein NWE89_07445 [Candidatus Bathyarchaeota archaeon]|nr:hypothetical protein [Candidatus Bathyarchaeota archaeon]
MSYKKDEKLNIKLLLAGMAIVTIFSVAGSQLMLEGRIYKEKVKFLIGRGYELDDNIAWTSMDTWEAEVLVKYKNNIDISRKKVDDWNEFYLTLKNTKNKPIFDESLYDYVHNCDESYVIWFSTIDLRGSSRAGQFLTYYFQPDVKVS